jgi:hypothetical protein
MEEHVTEVQEESELVFRLAWALLSRGRWEGYVVRDRIAHHPRCPESRGVPRVI